MPDKFQTILDDIRTSPKAIDVLPPDSAALASLTETYHPDPDTLLGALFTYTGGITVDHWLRIYGAGALNAAARNALHPLRELAVAEDVLGGLFLLQDTGNIAYFAPDCLELENLEISFSQFLYWCVHGDTDTFYKTYRWDGWQSDAAALGLDQGFAFFPFLWTGDEGLAGRTRSVVPMEEIIGLEFDFLRQLGGS